MCFKINSSCKKHISKWMQKIPPKCWQLLEGITPSHILIILKLYLEKNKNQNREETTCVLFLQKPRFTYNNIKPITIPIITVIYTTEPQKDQTTSGHSYTAHTMGNRQSCFQYRKTAQRLDERKYYLEISIWETEKVKQDSFFKGVIS